MDVVATVVAAAVAVVAAADLCELASLLGLLFGDELWFVLAAAVSALVAFTFPVVATAVAVVTGFVT